MVGEIKLCSEKGRQIKKKLFPHAGDADGDHPWDPYRGSTEI